MSYIWPIALIVLSNTVYHICAKSSPEGVNPFATLTVTYLIGIVCSVILYFVTGGAKDGLIYEYAKMNWAPYVLGIAIVGLEAGNIYAYKAGWPVSAASIVQNAILALVLLVVGCLFFKESLTWNRAVGIGICMVGLVFINWK